MQGAPVRGGPQAICAGLRVDSAPPGCAQRPDRRRFRACDARGRHRCEGQCACAPRCVFEFDSPWCARQNGESPLHWAARNGCAETAANMLRLGAYPAARDNVLSLRSRTRTSTSTSASSCANHAQRGNTALDMAKWHGRLAVVRALERFAVRTRCRTDCMPSSLIFRSRHDQLESAIHAACAGNKAPLSRLVEKGIGTRVAVRPADR